MTRSHFRQYGKKRRTEGDSQAGRTACPSFPPASNNDSYMLHSSTCPGHLPPVQCLEHGPQKGQVLVVGRALCKQLLELPAAEGKGP